MISELLYGIAASVWVWNPTETTYKYVVGAGYIQIACSVASQILLANIFWHLGIKITEDDATILVEEFDEDADLQANMWN